LLWVHFFFFFGNQFIVILNLKIKNVGGFMTESYATRGFKERLIHRVLLGKYAINEENGNIIVQDRESGALVEEKMPGFVRMGIRVLYQNDLNNHVLKMFFRTLRVIFFLFF